MKNYGTLEEWNDGWMEGWMDDRKNKGPHSSMLSKHLQHPPEGSAGPVLVPAQYRVTKTSSMHQTHTHVSYKKNKDETIKANTLM